MLHASRTVPILIAMLTAPAGVIAQQVPDRATMVAKRQAMIEFQRARRVAVAPGQVPQEGRAGRVGLGNGKYVTFEPDSPAPLDDGDEFDHPEVRPPVYRINLDNVPLERENLDRWLFGDDIPREGRPSALVEALGTRLGDANKMHLLTEPELAKLRLAGQGDIKRYLEEASLERDLFEKARHSFRTGLPFLRDLERRATIYKEGPFGDYSLFAKTLRRIVNERKTSVPNVP